MSLPLRSVLEHARQRRLTGLVPNLAELRRACDELPREHPDRPVVVAETGLASALSGENRQGSTMGEAARILTEAVSLLAADHPLRGEVLLSLGKALFVLTAGNPPRGLPDRIIQVMRAENDSIHPELARAVYGLALVLRSDEAIGLEHLRQVGRGLGVGHPLHGMIMAVVGTRLARNADLDGDADTVEIAEECLAAAHRELGDTWAHIGLPAHALRIPRAGCLVLWADRRREPREADRAIAMLESELARLSSTDPWAPRAMRFLGEAWRVRGELLDRPDDARRGYELIVAASAIPPTHPDAALLSASGALALADLADLYGPDDRAESAEPAQRGDAGGDGRDAAIGALVRAADRASLSWVTRAEVLLRLAAMLRARNGPGDAEHHAARLEQALDVLRDHPGHPLTHRVRAALNAVR